MSSPDGLSEQSLEPIGFCTDANNIIHCINFANQLLKGAKMPLFSAFSS